jgi:hypothetical protein
MLCKKRTSAYTKKSESFYKMEEIFLKIRAGFYARGPCLVFGYVSQEVLPLCIGSSKQGRASGGPSFLLCTNMRQ